MILPWQCTTKAISKSQGGGWPHVLSNMMQLPPTPPLSQKCTVKQVSTMHTWTCMKPQHQLPLLDTSLLHTQDSTTQLHDSRVSKQTRGQSHTILFLKFSLKDRNIIYDEFFLRACRTSKTVVKYKFSTSPSDP